MIETRLECLKLIKMTGIKVGCIKLFKITEKEWNFLNLLK
jgi:hypothetical protein